jgi:hypothetical protein
MMRPDRPSLLIEPVVSWPHEAEAGRRYLVTVDLRSPQGADEWPYDEEEFEFGFALDGAPHFICQALDDPSVVLHRFGGTYGPARFVVGAGSTLGPGAIWLTISNRWGVPVRTVELPSEVVMVPTGEAAETGIVVDAEPTVQEAAQRPDDVDAEPTVQEVAQRPDELPKPRSWLRRLFGRRRRPNELPDDIRAEPHTRPVEVGIEPVPDGTQTFTVRLVPHYDPGTQTLQEVAK